MVRQPIPCILIAGILSSGCFTHVPVEATAVPRGQEVVVFLGADASRRFSLDAGYTARSVRGIVESVDADSLFLSVWAGRRHQGVTVDASRRTHVLLLSDVVSIERRELNRARTALVAAGFLASVAFLIDQARGGSGGENQPRPPDNGPAPSILRR